jgi:hypothetical protein
MDETDDGFPLSEAECRALARALGRGLPRNGSPPTEAMLANDVDRVFRWAAEVRLENGMLDLVIAGKLALVVAGTEVLFAKPEEPRP